MKASLKEDATVDTGIDVIITLQPAQLVLIGTLSGILLIWMLTFAWLAIRPTPEIRARKQEESPLSPATLVVSAPAPVKLHPIPAAPVTTLVQDTGGEVVLEGSTR